MTRLAERPVPRYTSYPTAPHVHAGVDVDAYRGWLRALPADAGLSVYLHLPFCDTLCWYCGCHSKLSPATTRLRSLFASRALKSAGYLPIGLDHSALPHDRLAVASRNGALHRNFQSYTADSDGSLIGLGASAISALHEGYVPNHVPLHACAQRYARAAALVEIHGSRRRVTARHLVRTVAVVFDSRLADGGRRSRAV